MKLGKRAEIDAFFAKQPANVVGALIYGKDRSQVIERCTRLAKKIVPDITDPFNVSLLTDTDVEGDGGLLEGELQSLSLMGGKRLIRLKFFSEKAALDKAVAATLKAHAAGDFNKDAFIIIEAGGLGSDSALRRLADADKNLVSIACYEDETGDVVRMAREALAADGVSRRTKEALGEFFIDDHHTRHNLVGLVPMLERLGVLLGEIAPRQDRYIQRFEIAGTDGIHESFRRICAMKTLRRYAAIPIVVCEDSDARQSSSQYARNGIYLRRQLAEKQFAALRVIAIERGVYFKRH